MRIIFVIEHLINISSRTNSTPILIYEPDFINKFIHRDKDNAVNSNRKRVDIFFPSLHSCFQQGTSFENAFDL